jgi:hypothetical protein
MQVGGCNGELRLMALRHCESLWTFFTQREAFTALNRYCSTRIGGDTVFGVQDTVLQLSKDIKADVLCCKDESANIRPYSSTWY